MKLKSAQQLKGERSVKLNSQHLTCAQNAVVSPHIDVHRLRDQRGDDVRSVQHGRVMHERHAGLVLFAQARRGTLSAERLEHGHEAAHRGGFDGGGHGLVLVGEVLPEVLLELLVQLGLAHGKAFLPQLTRFLTHRPHPERLLGRLRKKGLQFYQYWDKSGTEGGGGGTEGENKAGNIRTYFFPQ